MHEFFFMNIKYIIKKSNIFMLMHLPIWKAKLNIMIELSNFDLFLYF